MAGEKSPLVQIDPDMESAVRLLSSLVAREKYEDRETIFKAIVFVRSQIVALLSTNKFKTKIIETICFMITDDMLNGHTKHI
jgi:hypothetical protein